MALWLNNCRIAIWEIRTSKNGKPRIKFTSSSKKQDGTWQPDFRGWASLGKKAAKAISDVPAPTDQKPVLASITQGNVTNYYDTSKKEEYWNVNIYDLEIADSSDRKQAAASDEDIANDEEEELPF